MQKFAQDNLSVTNRVVGAKDAIVRDGQDSFKLGTDIVKGQAVLAVLRSFVVPAKASLLSKLTGKAKYISKIVNSAYGSLAIAGTFHAIVTIIAPQNDKLRKAAQLALDAATVEAASTLPIQEYVDRIADKIFSAPVLKDVFDKKDD